MAVRDQLIEQTRNVDITNSFNQQNFVHQQPLATTRSEVNSKSTSTLTEFIKQTKDDLPFGWTMTNKDESIKVVYLQEKNKIPPRIQL